MMRGSLNRKKDPYKAPIQSLQRVSLGLQSSTHHGARISIRTNTTPTGDHLQGCQKSQRVAAASAWSQSTASSAMPPAPAAKPGASSSAGAPVADRKAHAAAPAALPAPAASGGKKAAPSAPDVPASAPASTRTVPRVREPKRRKRVAVDAGAEPKRTRLQANRSGRGARNGNYRGYYHRRLGRGDAGGDTRLALLREEWVPAGGAVLDVGCNDGAFTLEVARRFASAAVVGVDIDPALVAKAEARVRAAAASSDVLASGAFPATSAAPPAAAGPAAAAAPAAGAGGAASDANFPGFATFEACDVSAAGDVPVALERGRYDMVLALSVSKWIHLHGGDEGLCRFFARVHAALVPGGVFVLEPQPSRSYKRARQRGAVPKDRTMDTFKLRPEKFSDYLLSADGGFERVVTLREVLGKNIPFGTRPIFAFFKPKLDSAQLVNACDAGKNEEGKDAETPVAKVKQAAPPVAEVKQAGTSALEVKKGVTLVTEEKTRV